MSIRNYSHNRLEKDNIAPSNKDKKKDIDDENGMRCQKKERKT
jgi:hypothetical protein